MKWRDGSQNQNPESEQSIDEMDEEAYSAWRKGSGSGIFGGLLKPSYLVLAGVGLIVVVMAAAFMGGGEPEATKQQLMDLDAGLRQVEARLSKIEAMTPSPATDATDLTDYSRQIEGLRGRMDLLESALNQRLDELAKEVRKVESRASAAAEKPVSKPAAKATTVTKKETAVKAGRTHTVQSGDTLYSISRRYKVPVDALCRWNNIPSAECRNYLVKLGETIVVEGE